MHTGVGDIFKAIGPAASIIFAAWIFVGFLQVRFDAAVERYLDMLKQYRTKDATGARLDSLKEEILTYRRRCALMNVASTIGLASAIVLVMTLVVGIVALIFAKVPVLTIATISLAILGLVLIIVATLIVIFEGVLINHQLEHALHDMPELAEAGTAAESTKPKRKKLGLVR